MSKKPSKSIQAIIITLIAGMIIPKVFDISGNALLDKFLWAALGLCALGEVLVANREAEFRELRNV